MSQNLCVWLHGLGAAVIGGCATSVTASFAVPTAVNFTHDGLVAMGKIALAGAVLSVFSYLKQSPIPGPSCPTCSK